MNLESRGAFAGHQADQEGQIAVSPLIIIDPRLEDPENEYAVDFDATAAALYMRQLGLDDAVIGNTTVHLVKNVPMTLRLVDGGYGFSRGGECNPETSTINLYMDGTWQFYKPRLDKLKKHTPIIVLENQEQVYKRLGTITEDSLSDDLNSTFAHEATHLADYQLRPDMYSRDRRKLAFLVTGMGSTSFFSAFVAMQMFNRGDNISFSVNLAAAICAHLAGSTYAIRLWYRKFSEIERSAESFQSPKSDSPILRIRSRAPQDGTTGV